MTPVLVNGARAGSYGVEMVQNKKNCTPDHFTVPLNGAITRVLRVLGGWDERAFYVMLPPKTQLSKNVFQSCQMP